MPRAPAPAADDFNSPYSARNQPGMSTAYTQQGKGKVKHTFKDLLVASFLLFKISGILLELGLKSVGSKVYI